MMAPSYPFLPPPPISVRLVGGPLDGTDIEPASPLTEWLRLPVLDAAPAASATYRYAIYRLGVWRDEDGALSYRYLYKESAAPEGGAADAR